jgi:hypothetical protein
MTLSAASGRFYRRLEKSLFRHLGSHQMVENIDSNTGLKKIKPIPWVSVRMFNCISNGVLLYNSIYTLSATLRRKVFLNGIGHSPRYLDPQGLLALCERRFLHKKKVLSRRAKGIENISQLSDSENKMIPLQYRVLLIVVHQEASVGLPV